jgi:hypothetical protein
VGRASFANLTASDETQWFGTELIDLKPTRSEFIAMRRRRRSATTVRKGRMNEMVMSEPIAG